PLTDSYRGDRAERDLLPHRGQYRQIAQVIERIANFAGITHVDGKARQTIDHFTDIVATDSTGDDRLNIGDVEAIACRCTAVDIDIDITSASNTLSQCRADTGNRFRNAFDLRCNGV